MKNVNRAQDRAQEKPKRAALYMRVSTVYQVDKDSLPMQKQELQGYCEYVLGIKDYVCFEDAGYSGKNTDRPAFQKMMAQMRSGLFTHLVVWKIDRISRNLLDFARMYDELKKLGVVFISKNEQFDTSNAMGEAMLKIILVFAELERGMTSERVTATMINRASNGVWNGGKIPFGYDYDKESGKFSINEQEAEVVRTIFDSYEELHSVLDVTKRLNGAGIKSRAGNDFSAISAWSILKNPWYVGTYRYNYYKVPGRMELKDPSEWVIVENHHPAIIEKDRFDKLQVVISENSKMRNEPGRKITGKHTHVFAGLLWCAGCGCALTSSPARERASGYRPSFYCCPSLRKSDGCGAKYVSDPALGEFVLNYILNIMNAQKDFAEIHSPFELQVRLLRGRTFGEVENIDKDGLVLLYEMLDNYDNSDSVLMAKPKGRPKEKVDPELKRLQNEQKKQERALERLNHIYLYSDGSISDREYIMRKQQIIDALQAANDALGLIQQDPCTTKMSDDDFIAQASFFIVSQQLQDKKYVYYRNLAEHTEPKILKEFFNSLVDSIILRAGRVETIVFKNGLSNKFNYLI